MKPWLLFRSNRSYSFLQSIPYRKWKHIFSFCQKNYELLSTRSFSASYYGLLSTSDFSFCIPIVSIYKGAEASRASGCPPNTFVAGRSPHPLIQPLWRWYYGKKKEKCNAVDSIDSRRKERNRRQSEAGSTVFDRLSDRLFTQNDDQGYRFISHTCRAETHRQQPQSDRSQG